MQEYIKIFNGYRHAYGIADWTNAIVDPESGKQKPNYRWTYEEFTDTIYQEHFLFSSDRVDPIALADKSCLFSEPYSPFRAFRINYKRRAQIFAHTIFTCNLTP